MREKSGFVSVAQKAPEWLHTHGCPAPANTQRSKVLPYLLCSEFPYILYALPNYDQIRILTSSNIKILLLFPLSKELPRNILESRWALLSVPMKILFTMLYISRCDIISGTSHSPHLQWTTVLICVLGGEDLAAESHDVTLILYYFTIACK